MEKLLVDTQRQATPGLEVGDPSCPARVVVTDGVNFPCTVVVEGIAVPYTVTLVDVDAQRQVGRYDIRPAKAVIVVSKVVEALQRGNASLRVDCGSDRVRVLDPGQTMRCVVGGAGADAQQVVTFKVDDVLGTLSPVPDP